MPAVPMTPSAAAVAFGDALRRLRDFADELLAAVPGTAVLAFDANERLRMLAGEDWEQLWPDPQAMVGRSLGEVFTGDLHTPMASVYAAVLAGEDCSLFLCTGEDHLRWLSARPLRDEAGTVLGGQVVSWDGTDAKRAEDRYRLLAENATDIVTRHDADGRYLYVSPSVEAICGYSPAELLGRSCFAFIHPEDVPDVVAELNAAEAAGGVVTLDYRLRRKDGTYAYFESMSRWVADGEVQCSSRDISERRAAEAELSQRLAQQAAVARLGELALQRGNPGTLHSAACRLVAETLALDSSYSLEHLGDAQMRVRGSVGFHDGFTGSEFEVATFRHGGLGNAYADGAVVVDDLPSHPMRAAPLRAAGVVSCAHVLIGDGDRPLGLLGAHSRTPRPFAPQDLDFLQSVAHVLAGAMERLRVEERIRHDALHDALTGLPNRTLLLDRLRVALTRARRHQAHVALLFVDLDRLKVVNDSLGHHAGDDLLRGVGPRVREVVRPGDTVARFGGDEFAVLLEAVEDERDAIAVAERIVRAFEAPFMVAGEPRFGSASVGLVVARPGAPRSAEELLSDADAAMYRAKERGRGRWELFDAGLRDRITARLRMEADLRRALEEPGQLSVAYQPFWSLPERRIAGVEALVRWQHPQLGAVPPSDFIPLAEESALIVDLGARVLRAACAQVAGWRQHHPSLQLTVNVSARQVVTPGLVDTVAGVLAETGLEASALGLEITEGLLLEDSPSTAQTLAQLQALGVGLILDDFGTGYSSLRYLQRYALDGLKVDRAFVAGLGPDGDGDGAIVEAIVGMAGALGMRVIPEGVETPGQLARLHAFGLRYAQGFLLARPLTPEALEARLRDRRATP